MLSSPTALTSNKYPGIGKKTAKLLEEKDKIIQELLDDKTQTQKAIIDFYFHVILELIIMNR